MKERRGEEETLVPDRPPTDPRDKGASACSAAGSLVGNSSGGTGKKEKLFAFSVFFRFLLVLKDSSAGFYDGKEEEKSVPQSP